MRLMKSGLAVAVTAGAIAAATLPATASADPIGCATVIQQLCAAVAVQDPCVEDPSVPTCVNDVFDRIIWSVETGRGVYNNTVQPLADDAVCRAWEIVFDEECPGDMVPHL